VLFNAGCNKQVFLLHPKNKFGADPFCRWEKNAKNAHFNSEKWRHWAED